jgi:hypothetical protein
LIFLRAETAALAGIIVPRQNLGPDFRLQLSAGGFSVFTGKILGIARTRNAQNQWIISLCLQECKYPYWN